MVIGSINFYKLFIFVFIFTREYFFSKDDDQDALLKGLYTLKEALNEAKDLSYLEPGVFLAPFLEIIRSEETTGPVTSLALSAVNKIISYGLIGA